MEVDPPVFLFFACALKREGGALKNRHHHHQDNVSIIRTYPGTRIIGGRADITESPDEGGEFCKNNTSRYEQVISMIQKETKGDTVKRIPHSASSW